MVTRSNLIAGIAHLLHHPNLHPARHFINQYPGIVTKVDVRLVKDLWTRVVNKDSHGRMAQHNHAFVKVGPHNTYTQYVTCPFDGFGTLGRLV